MDNHNLKMYKLGDILYRKGRYGVIREVTVLEDEGEYVIVSLSDNVRNKVRKEKLIETPPKHWVEQQKKIKEELRKQDAYFRKHFK